MEIINIIVTHPDTGVVSIESFGIIEDQLRNDVVQEAENAFIQKCVDLKFGEYVNETREDLNERNFFREEASESLEDGYFNIGENLVSIVWSNVENIQL